MFSSAVTPADKVFSSCRRQSSFVPHSFGRVEINFVSQDRRGGGDLSDLFYAAVKKKTANPPALILITVTVERSPAALCRAGFTAENSRRRDRYAPADITYNRRPCPCTRLTCRTAKTKNKKIFKKKTSNSGVTYIRRRTVYSVAAHHNRSFATFSFCRSARSRSDRNRMRGRINTPWEIQTS